MGISWLRRQVTPRRADQHHVLSFNAQVVVTTLTNVLIASQGIVTGVLLARLLGPSGRGDLAAIQTWPTFVATIGVLGIGDALVYFSSVNRTGAGSLLVTSIALALLVVPLSVVPAFMVLPALLPAQSPDTVQLARVYLLMAPLNAMLGMFTHSLRGTSAVVQWNVARALPALVWLFVIAIAWLLGTATAGTIALGYLAGLALLIVPYTLLARSATAPPYRVEPSVWPQLLRYGVPSVLATAPATLNLRLDQMLMAALFPSSMLGLYVAAVAWSGALTPFLSAIPGVLTPHVASAHETRHEQLDRLSLATRVSTLLALVGVLLLGAITPSGLPALFGDEFRPVTTAALILVLAAAVMSMNIVLESGANGLGHPSWCLYAELAGLAATGVGLFVLLQPLQLIGAALTSLVGYTTVLVVLVWRICASTGLKPGDLLLPRGAETLRAGKTLVAKLQDATRLDGARHTRA